MGTENVDSLRPGMLKPRTAPLRFASYLLDLDGCALIRSDGSEVALTHNEFALLREFVRHRGRVLSRDYLLDALAGKRADPFDRSIDMLVARLRRKMEPEPKQPTLIVTVPGEGYKFAASVVEAAPTPLPDPDVRPTPLTSQLNDTPPPPNGTATPSTGAGTARPTAAARRSAAWPRWWRWGAIAVMIVAVIATGAVAWLHPWRPVAKPSSGLASSVAGAKPSLVVLPFENLSDNKQQEFFVDGLTEDLITDLSNLSGIFVISRNTAFTYKNQTTRPTQIAKDLGVTYVVNGSVRRDAGRVRITAELIDALNDRQIWAQRYDRDLVDVFAVEDEVKKEIVQSLAVKLTPGEQVLVSSAPTKNIEAYDYYLRGRSAMNATGPARLGLAYWALEKAIALDPDFAEAYASLALTNVIDLTRESGSLSNTDSHGSPQSMRAQAIALAQKAASLKPSLSIPDIVSAHLGLWDRRYDEAIEHARRAVEHKPGNVDAYLTQALVLTAAGLHREARAAIDEVLHRDPRPSSTAYAVLGMIQFALRDNPAAIASLETFIRQSELFFGNGSIYPAFLFAAYGEAGSRDKAKALTLSWGYSIINWDLSLVQSQEFYRRSEDTAYLLDGLRMAGAPELPLGFDPKTDAGDQLAGPALRSSLLRSSFHPVCTFQEGKLTVRFADDGTMDWKLRDDINDPGNFRVDGSKLYLTLPVLTRNRETSFVVYRNGNTSKLTFGRGYDFVLVGPFLCFFSLDK